MPGVLAGRAPPTPMGVGVIEERRKDKEAKEEMTAWWRTAGPTARANPSIVEEVVGKVFQAGYCTVSVLGAACETEMRGLAWEGPLQRAVAMEGWQLAAAGMLGTVFKWTAQSWREPWGPRS